MDQGPTPMDIGSVGGQEADEEYWQDEDVQGVRANVQCHKCGGWDHFQRECPTEGNKGGWGKGGGNDAQKVKGRGGWGGEWRPFKD